MSSTIPLSPREQLCNRYYSNKQQKRDKGSYASPRHKGGRAWRQTRAGGFSVRAGESGWVSEGWARDGQGVGLLPPPIYITNTFNMYIPLSNHTCINSLYKSCYRKWTHKNTSISRKDLMQVSTHTNTLLHTKTSDYIGLH
jgi:hypothetical protein